MRFLIIPLGFIQKGLERILGKKELDDLSNDLLAPVAEFVDEVYEDTAGDVARELSGRSDRRK